MERYKGINDKERYKLGIEKKYELECARAFVFAEGYTISDVSLIYWNHKGIINGILEILCHMSSVK